MTPVGEAIERLLSERGWTQEQLSDNSDPTVSQGQISNYKSGKRNPSRDSLRALARAFVSGMDVETAERHYRSVVNELLSTAGFKEDFPRDDARALSPQALALAEIYDGADEAGRRLLDMAREGVVRTLSRDSIGRSAEDFGKRSGDDGPRRKDAGE